MTITPAPYINRVNIQAPPVPPVTVIRVDIPRGFPIPPPIGDFARLSQPNVFLRENTFPAIRVTPRLITHDTVLTATDGDIVIDCSVEDTDITVTLPISAGTGHQLRANRKDITTHSATVITQGSDVINNGLTVFPMAISQTVTLAADALDYWDLAPFLPPFVFPDNIALLDQNNFFTGVNSFGGMRWARRVISDSTSVQDSDYAIYVQGATADIDIQLPPALVADSRGQPLRVKILDDAPYVVRVNAVLGDLIDDAASVTLVGKFTEAQLLEADEGVWDLRMISGTEEGTLPSTTNLFAGDGFGDAVDSGIDPATVMTLPLSLTKLRIATDGTLQIFNPDQNLFHTLTVRGSAGAEYLTIDAGVA